MDLNLTGKLALVTGSTAGIGRAICEALLREGARVIGAGGSGIARRLCRQPARIGYNRRSAARRWGSREECLLNVEERMTGSMCRLWVGSLSVALLAGCGGSPERAEAPAPGGEAQPAPGAAVAGAGERMVAVPTADAKRPFVRVNFDTLQWRATEGNTLGVQTAILEGDPSKPGFYLTINRFPPGVMSRPHYHPDERYVVVLRGTWNTGEGDAFTPEKTVPLKVGDYMRHPAGGHHYDGGLDEEAVVAISGYGPTRADVIDGGELFGRSR